MANRTLSLAYCSLIVLYLLTLCAAQHPNDSPTLDKKAPAPMPKPTPLAEPAPLSLLAPKIKKKCAPPSKACGPKCCDPGDQWFGPEYFCRNQQSGLCCRADEYDANGICCPNGYANCNGKCCGGSCDTSTTAPFIKLCWEQPENCKKISGATGAICPMADFCDSRTSYCDAQTSCCGKLSPKISRRGLFPEGS